MNRMPNPSRLRPARRTSFARRDSNLALLGAFKYLGFFVDSVNTLVSAFGFEGEQQVLELALPVGISFFTFQAISYVVDVYRGRAPLATPIDTAVYLSFFPHLVAGPIVRATEFIPQLATPRSPRNIPAAPALFLIAGGLIKKVGERRRLMKYLKREDSAAYDGLMAKLKV